jgi:hypothetical protein
MSRDIRLKNIARIEQTRPGRGTTKGWYVQVIWGGHRYTKWFGDSGFGGKRKALVAAADWRDSIEKKIGRPATDEPVYSERSGRKSQSGVWLWKGQKDGRPAYWITFRRPDGRLSHTTVSVTRYGKTQAMEIAKKRYETIRRSLRAGRDPYAEVSAKAPAKRAAKSTAKATAKKKSVARKSTPAKRSARTTAAARGRTTRVAARSKAGGSRRAAR